MNLSPLTHPFRYASPPTHIPALAATHDTNKYDTAAESSGRLALFCRSIQHPPFNMPKSRASLRPCGIPTAAGAVPARRQCSPDSAGTPRRTCCWRCPAIPYHLASFSYAQVPRPAMPPSSRSQPALRRAPIILTAAVLARHSVWHPALVPLGGASPRLSRISHGPHRQPQIPHGSQRLPRIPHGCWRWPGSFPILNRPYTVLSPRKPSMMYVYDGYTLSCTKLSISSGRKPDPANSSPVASTPRK